MLWGFVNMLDAQVRRLDRGVDRLAPKLRDLQRQQDGTEINARELELTTDRAQNLGKRRDAFETMRDAAAGAYREATGDTWRPRYGSHVSHTGKLTSAAIDARDFLRARKDRETNAHLPDGTLIAVAGGKDVTDIDAIFARLDRARAKYRDMVLVHGNGPGVERIAAKWAERHGVHQVVCKPDWNAHGRAAPFRRNDDLLNLLPKGVIAFPGSGISDSEWAGIEKEAKARGMTAAELVRYAAVGLSAGKLDRASAQFPPEIAAQIERIYRGVYLLSTLRRDGLVRDGQQEELDRIVNAACESQASIHKEVVNPGKPSL